MTLDQPSSKLRLRLTRAAETQVRKGHPWVFSESIRSQDRPGRPGELAVIYDRRDRFLAVGLWDPDSPIRVKVLQQGKPCPIDDAWLVDRWMDAARRRQGVVGPETDGYRVMNGESDRLPGVVLDRYGTTYVLKLYSAAWVARLPSLTSTLSQTLGPERLVLRLSRNIADFSPELEDGKVLLGSDLDGIPTFLESGLRFEADVQKGQKTGFFLDQRENRRKVAGLAAGRRVLNAFSFSGGFSVYAARGGAVSVTDLDISRHALAGSERNFALNGHDPRIQGCRQERIQGDVFRWLDGSADRRFDLIVLDPPSLARRQSEREGALAAYGRLVRGAIQRLPTDGILVAASCSARVPADDFFQQVRSAARRSGRRFREMETTGHAADHPADFPEANYLKAIYLRF